MIGMMFYVDESQLMVLTYAHRLGAVSLLPIQVFSAVLVVHRSC